MNDATIQARLKLAGEEFDAERRRLFGDLETDAEQSGNRMGANLKRGLIAGGIFVVANELRQVLELVGGAVLDNARELDEASRAAGITVERYQSLIAAGREFGVRGEEMSDALSSISEALHAVESGADNGATEALQRMGLEQAILADEITNTDELLRGIVASSDEYATRTEYLSDVIAILGTEISDELLTAIASGDEALLRQAGLFEESGNVIQDEYIRELREAEIAVESFKTNTINTLTIWAANTNSFFDEVAASVDNYAFHLGLATEAEAELILERNRSNTLSLDFGFSDFWTPTTPEEARRAARERERESRPEPRTRTRARGRSGRSAVDQEAQAAERYSGTLADIVADLELAEELTDLRGRKLFEEADEMEALAALHARLPELIGAQTAEQQTQLETAERLTLEAIARGRAIADAETISDKESDAADALADKLLDAEEDAQRLREDNVRDLADLYEEAFADGTGSIWDTFEDMGRRAIAELLAQWSAGFVFSDGGKAGGAGGLIGSLGSLLGAQADFSGAASSGGIKGGNFGWYGSAGDAIVGADGGLIVQGSRASVGKPNPLFTGSTAPMDLLGGAGIGSFTGQIPELFGLEGSSLGGAVGGAAGQAIGGPIGAAIGGAIVSTIFGAFKSTKRGSASIGVDSFGELSIGSTRGNSSSRVDASSDLALSAIQGFNRIVDALGADVIGTPSVSFGVRKDNLRLDTSGQGITKTKNGAIDFGQDADALIAAGIADMLQDVTLAGISQASQNLIRNAGNDIESAIEKALQIESIPRLLRERLDPLGAELEAIDEKFADLADTLYEAGASADQVADARQLWELEREEARQSFGEASAQLQDFLDTLQFGSNSPLSLRDQLAFSGQELQPFLDQIRAGEQAGALSDFDQAGYQAASQDYLAILRALEGSTQGFFEGVNGGPGFDDLREFTQTAIGLIDSSVPVLEPAQDPFTQATAEKLQINNELLEEIRDGIKNLGGFSYSGGGGSGFAAGGSGFGVAL